MKPTKNSVTLLLGILLVSGLACAGGGTSSEPTPTLTSTTTATVNENTGSFEIYLAVNLSGYDYDYYANCSDVENMTLSEEPIMSTEDIISYNWSDHSIQLTGDGCHHVSTALEEINRLVSPFVVVANGERIYVGAFVSMLSSYWPGCPSIWYLDTEYLCNYSSGNLVIGSGLYASNESDVRYDNRIYESLKQAGKLIE